MVEIPDYVTATLDGKDQVTIPGGSVLIELGHPIVPYYTAEYQLEDSAWVQSVALTDTSEPEQIDNLYLKTAELEWDCSLGSQAMKTPETVVDIDEWPDKYYDWRVEVKPDGHRWLIIDIYPFHHYPSIAMGKFYKNFTFSILTNYSTVEILSLAAEQRVYDPGDIVTATLWLTASGESQDVIVATAIRSVTTGEVVDGLPMRRINGLMGSAIFTQQWDSSGQEPGEYIIEAQVHNLYGSMLDRKSDSIGLGWADGIASDLSVLPDPFTIGDPVSIQYQFTNTGTLPITGTAMIEVKNVASGEVEQLSQAINDLAPQGSIPVSVNWDTTGASAGDYKVVGYVLFGSQTTDPLVMIIRSYPKLYLPVIMRR